MQAYKLSVVTPDSTLFEAEVLAAIFPGTEGSFEVLANHAPIIVMVKAGIVEVMDKNEKEFKLQVQEGFFEFSENKGTLLTMP